MFEISRAKWPICTLFEHHNHIYNLRAFVQAIFDWTNHINQISFAILKKLTFSKVMGQIMCACACMGIRFSAKTQLFLANFDKILHRVILSLEILGTLLIFLSLFLWSRFGEKIGVAATWVLKGLGPQYTTKSYLNVSGPLGSTVIYNFNFKTIRPKPPPLLIFSFPYFHFTPLLVRLKNRENELNAAKKRNIDKLLADIEAMITWLGELKDLLNNNQVKSLNNINPIIEIIKVSPNRLIGLMRSYII